MLAFFGGGLEGALRASDPFELIELDDHVAVVGDEVKGLFLGRTVRLLKIHY